MRLALLVLALTTLAPGQEKPRKPARISGGVMAGQILTKTQPIYPPEAKFQHISGLVVMRAIIAKDGSIANLTVVSGSPLLAPAAIDAVSRWTYKPYTLNGQPTEVDTTITVNFTMEPAPAGPPLVRVSGGVMAGYILTRVFPVFPQITRDQKISGAGVMHAVIGTDGHVKSIVYISGPDVLRQAYLDAVKQCVYRPYLIDGTAVEVDTTVTITSAFGG